MICSSTSSCCILRIRSFRLSLVWEIRMQITVTKMVLFFYLCLVVRRGDSMQSSLVAAYHLTVLIKSPSLQWNKNEIKDVALHSVPMFSTDCFLRADSTTTWSMSHAHLSHPDVGELLDRWVSFIHLSQSTTQWSRWSVENTLHTII